MSGLGIVDASVSPFVPQNNLQILVYAAAEKASDLIREQISTLDAIIHPKVIFSSSWHHFARSRSVASDRGPRKA